MCLFASMSATSTSRVKESATDGFFAGRFVRSHFRFVVAARKNIARSGAEQLSG